MPKNSSINLNGCNLKYLPNLPFDYNGKKIDLNNNANIDLTDFTVPKNSGGHKIIRENAINFPISVIGNR